ncbi:Trichothecene C-15 hydroxylase [Colletotrichum spinosum]|uniref:Trichothecene C-15 hydroxylase n=1 Tax=Colletotrichum spinosum TaxID=1347390 RepID=A0A4R8Q2L6_9PEZI|nr:Trichothecene C-15 hydroxylase [Colletotrichum spinosum]
MERRSKLAQPIGDIIVRIIYNVYFYPLRYDLGQKLYAVTNLAYANVVRITLAQLSYVNADACKDIFGHRKQGQQEHIKDTSRTHQGHIKDPIVHPLFKGNIIGADCEINRRLRRLLSHGFSAQAMLNQQPMIPQYVDLLVQRLYENCQNGAKKLDMVG